MQLGIFAKTFIRPNLEATLEAVQAHGLSCVQFNLACVGVPTVPADVEPALAERVRLAFQQRSLSMTAISGTCNLIEPDPAKRATHLRRLRGLISACHSLGTSLVTLCTGSRDPVDMWRAHPDNASPAAWRDLLASLEAVLETAEAHQVMLGVEPEPANVIDNAVKARQLLNELRSPALKIIFDGANLLRPESLGRQEQVFSQALALLAGDIVLAHAKDLARRGGGQFVGAGLGAMDYPLYLSLLRQHGFTGPLILHNLEENAVPAAVAFLRSQLGPPSNRGSEKTNALLQPR